MGGQVKRQHLRKAPRKNRFQNKYICLKSQVDIRAKHEEKNCFFKPVASLEWVICLKSQVDIRAKREEKICFFKPVASLEWVMGGSRVGRERPGRLLHF